MAQPAPSTKVEVLIVNKQFGATQGLGAPATLNLLLPAGHDAMCGAGIGTGGSLDFIDTNGAPRSWISADKEVVAAVTGR